MLYPFSDVKPVIHTVIDEKKFLDGIYVELQGNFSALIMRIPQQMLIKMVAQEFYNPFYEDDLREIYKRFMENEDKYKNFSVFTAAAHVTTFIIPATYSTDFETPFRQSNVASNAPQNMTASGDTLLITFITLSLS